MKKDQIIKLREAHQMGHWQVRGQQLRMAIPGSAGCDGVLRDSAGRFMCWAIWSLICNCPDYDPTRYKSVMIFNGRFYET